MIPGRVSVIIPSNNEPYLARTIQSVLEQAAGDVEIFACLDELGEQFHGNHREADDYARRFDQPRVIVLPFWDRTHMRPMENLAIAQATGEFLLKLDAHCILGPAWDTALKAHCAPGDLVIPTRHSIDERDWRPRLREYNYAYLTWPFALSMYGYGLHAKTFSIANPNINRDVNEARRQFDVDDVLSFQGSAWFQRKADFDRLGPLDHEHYYFYQEAQEVGLRVWMSGGRCRVDKTTWYAHLHKGHDNVGANGREGRGFFLNVKLKREAEKFAADFWVNDRWPGATRTFIELIDRFAWMTPFITNPAECWPDDWRNFAKYKALFEARPPELTPAHT